MFLLQDFIAWLLDRLSLAELALVGLLLIVLLGAAAGFMLRG